MLEGPERPLLLEDAPEASDVGPANARSTEERLQEADEATYARHAARVVTYTIWFLLAAIVIGTVVGIILVTRPIQNDAIPG